MTDQVYICYASEDKGVADAVCSALEASGIRCWISPRDVVPGTEMGEAIGEALTRCSVVVLIFSGHANASRQVGREIERATSRGKTIFPFRIEDVVPSRALEYWLGALRWLDALTPPLERHLAKLCDMISRAMMGGESIAAPMASAPAPSQPSMRPPMPPSALPRPMPPMPPAGVGGKSGWFTGLFKTPSKKPGPPPPPIPRARPPAAAPPPRPSAPPEPTQITTLSGKIADPAVSVPEAYRCSAFYPERIEAEATGKIVVSIHLESVAPDVVREAARRLDLPASDRMKAGSSVAAMRLPRHGVVGITLDVPGLSFETTQASLGLWEDQQFAEFRFRPEPGALGQLCRGWVHFWLEGMVLADVAVAILVERQDVPAMFREALAEANARPYRFVFPSYSHEDKEAVERLEAYAESFGDTYLRDVRSLRAGQQWSPELLRFIKRAQVFQLFWSEPAARSPYVESEWKFALEERNGRPDPYFVRPIYWTEKPAAIPEALSHIHFAKVPLIRG